jgi:hypothetical protein
MCSGWRKYRLDGSRYGVNPSALWRVEIRYHEDECVSQVLPEVGVDRQTAKKIEKSVNASLDHDRFYTELVELN